MHVQEILKFKKTFLRKLKPEIEGDRSAWQRFVLIKLDAREAHDACIPACCPEPRS